MVQVIPFARQFGDQAQLLGTDPPQDPSRGDRLAGILREGQIAGLCLALRPEVLRLAHAETYRAGAQGRRALSWSTALVFRYLHGAETLAVEQISGSCFAQRASSDWRDVLCPESAASPASGGWFGMRPSGADRAGQPRRARWFEVAAKNPMQGFCATRTQPRSLRFSGPGIGSTFDV